MSLQYINMKESQLLNPGGWNTNHPAINSSAVTVTYQFELLFANLFGCKYNVNPKLILGILGMETNYGYTDPMQCGYNDFMTSMDHGTDLLVNQKMAAYSSIPSALSAYNGLCQYSSISNSDFLPYGASATCLTLNNAISGDLYTNFVGYMPTLDGPSCVNLMNTCNNGTCSSCGYGPVTVSQIGSTC
ncbi:hypothetical protein D2Q93_04460 [Alicyclobacillaceae bacterium I2511]|nr:hypothetical protein D2Q93_04460 [Alicyclobacillaceae bacterium I2511]